MRHLRTGTALPSGIGSCAATKFAGLLRCVWASWKRVNGSCCRKVNAEATHHSRGTAQAGDDAADFTEAVELAVEFVDDALK